MSWKAERLGIDVPSQGKLLLMARNMDNPVHQALFILEYLTAGRISEVLSLRRKQLRMDVKDGRQVLCILHMLNEKNKRKTMKTFYIPVDKEGKLVTLLLDYINTRHGFIFPFRSRQRAWQILKKYGLFPHFLRHIRLTHLVTIYGFSDRLLVEYAGWRDSQPAQFYIQLKSDDVLEKMK